MATWPELQSIPWGINSEVKPSLDEDFEPFIVAGIIYPRSRDIMSALSARNMRISMGDGDESPDLVRVVVDQEGRVHSRYNHLVRRGDQIVYELRHHGGKLGVFGMQPVIDQCDRILDRILGFKFDPNVRKRLQRSRETGEADIARPKITFSAALVGLRASFDQETVPGEKDKIGEYLRLTDGAMRDIAIPFPSDDNGVWRAEVLDILHRQLHRKKATPMILATRNLEEYLSARDDETALNALRRMEGNFHSRLEDLSGTTAGVIRRRTTLVDFRGEQERVVDYLYDRVMRTVGTQDQKLTEQVFWRVVNRLVSDADRNYFSRLVLQPYKGLADKLDGFHGLRTAIDEKDLERGAGSLKASASDLQAFERKINREILGRPNPV